jgi:hypothetical protein
MFYNNRIGGIMVSVIASSAVYGGLVREDLVGAK